MKRILKKLFILSFFIIAFAVFIYFFYFLQTNEAEDLDPKNTAWPDKKKIIKGWSKLSGNRKGKVVFARPPHMFILYLDTGLLKRIPNVTVTGGKGRRNRGKTPRPSWFADGKRFVYRYNKTVYVSNENGNKTVISNKKMDCSDETRWTWHRQNEQDWVVGPSINENVILVKISDPTVVKIAYHGGDVEKHCEITGENYVVYDNGSDIYVTRAYSQSKGIKISRGQNCRPCASPDNRVAWLPSPHIKYLVFDASTGRSLGAIHAPEGEEIYRLNWSNDPDYAVHMFGSRGYTRIQVRKVSTGENLFIGWGWDPDLWIEKNSK